MQTTNTLLESEYATAQLDVAERWRLQELESMGCETQITTIKYLQEPGTKANWMAIKTGILNSLPKWAKSVPFQIKSIFLREHLSLFVC